METILDPIEEQFVRIQNSKIKDTQKKKVEFDEKNYLNVKLGVKETEKKLTVRLFNLTPDANTPFAEVHMHYLPAEKRSYVCAKLTDNLPEKHEKNCPFCDIREEAHERQKGASEAEWKKLKDIYNANGATLNYVARVIDRNDEDFGVKFWKFNQAIYENIIDIYKNNKVDDINIFDKLAGKDLIITIKKKDGKSKITNISAANKQTPLAATEDNINKLITDEKVWTDVYGIKPYEYLDLVINGKTPFFDKTQKMWVEKKEKEVDTTEDEIEDEYTNTSDESEVEDGEGTGASDDLPF